MKRLLAGLALAFGAAFAHAATLVPIQLLNPAGSTSGQVLSSAGPSAVPAWTTITLSGLGGVTSAQAAAAAPVQSVAGRTGAVTLAVGDVSGAAPIASPTFTGTVTIPTGASITKPNIVGTATNDNAASGNVGEYLTNTTSATSVTSTVYMNATSVSLTAGDWDVSCSARFNSSSATFTQTIVGVGTTSAALPAFGNFVNNLVTYVANSNQVVASPTARVSVSATTTAYCVATAAFASGTATVDGFIRARRVR